MTGGVGPTTSQRRALRTALLATAPWLQHDAGGPMTVDAGQCDRCGLEPRLLPTCGPVAWRALCRTCGLAVGVDGAWCDGHAEDAAALLGWADALPPWWGDAVVLYWVASGELAWDPSVTKHPALPVSVREALHID